MENVLTHTTYLHIRSKDGAQLTDERNTNFTVNLVSPVVVPPNHQVLINVISVEIPHAFYAVSPDLGNNTIIWDTVSTLTLPTQNYDPPELLRVMNADAAFPFTVTYNRFTNTVTFTNDDAVPHTLNWATSTASKLLGFLLDDHVVAPGASTTSHGMIDLATVHSLFIKSNLGQGNVLSTREGNSSTLQKISVDVDPYGIIYLDAADRLTHSVLQTNVIDHITFRITDQNDNLIDMNHVNFEFSLRFQIVKDSVADTTTDTLTDTITDPRLTLRRQTPFPDTQTQASPDDNPPIEKQPITDLVSETLLDLLLE